jgi:WD40 repeat protein
MSVLPTLVLLAAQAQEATPVELVRTFGDDRWLSAPLPFERVALSPEGRRIAATSRDLRLQAWEVDTRRLLLDVPFPEGSKVVDLLLPDESTLVASHADRVLRVWSLVAPEQPPAAHRIAATFPLAPSGVAGEIFVSTSRVDVRSGETRLQLQPAQEVDALVAGDARVFAGRGREILEWDARSGALLGRLGVDPSAGRVRCLALGAARLLSGHPSGRHLEWDLATREPRVVLEPPAARPPDVLSCAWHGTTAVAVHACAWVRRADGTKSQPPLFGAASAAFTRNGAWLAVAEAPPLRGVAEIPLGWNHPGPWSIALWEVADARARRPDGGAHDAPILEAATAGARQVTRSRDAIVLWKESGEILVRVTDAPGAFAIDGLRLLTRSAAGVRVWDLEAGRPAAALQEAGAAAGGLLAAGARVRLGRKEDVETWDLDTGRRSRSIPCGGPVLGLHRHPDAALAVVVHPTAFSVVDGERVVARIDGRFVTALSADGRRAAVCGEDDVRVVETATGTSLGRQAVGGPPRGLWFGSDVLWIGLDGNRLVRWEWTSGARAERVLAKPVGAVLALDGRRLIVGSGADLHGLDFDTGEWSPPAQAHRGPIGELRRVGDRLLSLAADRTARLWTLKRP